MPKGDKTAINWIHWEKKNKSKNNKKGEAAFISVDFRSNFKTVQSRLKYENTIDLVFFLNIIEIMIIKEREEDNKIVTNYLNSIEKNQSKKRK